MTAAAFSVSSEAYSATSPLTKLAEPLVAKAYSGCPVPSTPTQVFYVDPVNGSMSGDGSAARPWHTLAEVINGALISTMPSHFDNTTHQQVNNNPNAPIKPGATIYLMSGNHGKVTIQGWLGVGNTLAGYDNSSFITIAAAPGQTPVLTQLSIIGGNKWAFRGLTIQGINTTGQFMTAYNGVYNDYWLVNLTGPHSNIIFDNNHLLSQANVSAWSMADWQSKRASGIADSKGTCIAITNNTLQNVGFGMQSQNGDKVLIGGNTVDHFTDDALDWGSNNMLVVGNVVTNSVEDGDGFHRDAMQGQPYTPTSSYHNVTFKKNTIIRITDPTNPFPSELQGIDTFDGIWSNIVVKNNVVITGHATQGIGFYGVHHLNITNNIVLGDGGKVLPCGDIFLPQCVNLSVIYDTTTYVPSLNIDPGKDGTSSSDVTIQNNTVSGLAPTADTSPLTMLNNKCVLGTNGKCILAVPVNGVDVFQGYPGTYYGNTITAGNASTIFRVFDTANMVYDLRLK
ncbi:MAG TPA: hypothetical protein VG798_06250 [Rhizomicrobium sp.]|nr:hypothetical protein [Rhizomicrobium sp.]